MNTVLRTLIWLLVVLWLGGVMFFPIVAAVSFTALPDAHAAGTVARLCLNALHKEGLGAGLGLLTLLALSGALGRRWKPVLGPIALTLVMLLLTAFSQFSIIPRMERLRLGVGGDMASVSAATPARGEFDHLHRASVLVEEGVLVAGLLLIALLAREPRRP